MKDIKPMEQYYLLTYVHDHIEIDLVKNINIDKIQITAITADYLKNIDSHAKENKIRIIAIEPYSLLQFKVKVIEDLINKK